MSDDELSSGAGFADCADSEDDDAEILNENEVGNVLILDKDVNVENRNGCDSVSK